MKLGLILKNLKVEPSQGNATGSVNSGGLFSRLLEQTMKSARGLLSPAARKGAKAGGTDRGWLEHFRNRLMSLGIPLKDMSLSSDAFPDLKKLLMGQGYSESEINSFLKKLLHGKPWPEIKVTELLEKLSELKALSKKKSPDPAIEVSAVAYIEASLHRLGLDVQEVNRAIAQARARAGQVNLESLIQNLKGILRGLPEGKQLKADGKAAEDIKGMLARIGMINKAGDVNGPISLERFIQILEQRMASMMPGRLSDTQIENRVDRLMDNVLVASGQDETKSSVRPLYGGKLKGLPGDDLKANQAHKQIGKGEDPALQVKRPATEVKGTAEFQTKKEKEAFFPKMEKLVEAIEGARGKKAVDQDKGTLLHGVREAIMDRVPVMKEGGRPIPVYVANQVARQISLSLQRGENHIRLQLKPPQLGSIQIDMDMKDSVLKIGITTELHSVKEFLTTSIHELRDTLVQQGVKLERVDIQVSYNLDQSMAHTQRDLKHAHSGRRSSATASAISSSEADSKEDASLANIRSNALLDMFA